MSHQQPDVLDEHDDDPDLVQEQDDGSPPEDEGAETAETGSEDDDDDKQRRERRRQERKAREARRKAARDRTQAEIAALRVDRDCLADRLQQIEQRLGGHDMSRVDQAITGFNADVNAARAALKAAVEAGDVDGQVQAHEALLVARQRLQEVEAYRRQVTAQPQRPQPQPQKQAVDPIIKAQYDDFLDEHDWFDPAGGDEDSRLAIEISDDLARRGIDPKSPRHWRELRARLRDEAPHLFEEDGEVDRRPPPSGKSKPARPPIAGSGRSAGKSDTFVLSAERRKAMEEMGAWDDPDRRKRMIDAYREYDKQQATSKR